MHFAFREFTQMHEKLIDSMVRYGIGLDPWFFQKNADAPNFPPHNIIQLDNDHYQLTLAVAGFVSDDIQIILESDILTVHGHKPDEPAKAGRQVLYRGIAFRDFSRQFKIGDNVQVQDVTLQHGLLQISLVRQTPEADKPKLIKISA
jgi:molecular chaperone IbpA